MAYTPTLTPTHEAPYRGLRVLDLGQGVASPYCAMLLAVYGADVIKVEPPEGDWSRRLGTTYGGHSALSAVYNRGKQGLCLDLKNPQGIAVAQALAATSDIIIEGFRPGVMARLGLGYDEISRKNPGLIYVSISGFGQTGSYSQRPCSDSVAQAFSGLVSVNVGSDAMPHRVGATLSDVSTGLYAFQAVTTTLFARVATGLGRWLDISLTQSTAALLGHKLAEHVLAGGSPRALNVPAGSYPTSDGWIMVTLVKEMHYQRLCRVIGRDDLATDPRFANFARRSDAADALIPQVRDAFKRQTTDVWLSRLQAADIIAERILNPGEWMNNPHVVAEKGAVSVKTAGVGTVHAPRTPGSFGLTEDNLGPAPDVGQHSRVILADRGYDCGSIEALIASGAVQTQAS